MMISDLHKEQAHITVTPPTPVPHQPQYPNVPDQGGSVPMQVVRSLKGHMLPLQSRVNVHFQASQLQHEKLLPGGAPRCQSQRCLASQKPWPPSRCALARAARLSAICCRLKGFCQARCGC